MHRVAHPDSSSPPPDVCLLLRAHAEQHWLSHEVVPVLRQLEQREFLPEEELGAALAYLEALWIEATGRAAETDTAYAELDAPAADGDPALSDEARGYHAAVRGLRAAVASHVARLVSPPSDVFKPFMRHRVGL
jgi:hypothetical protein